MAALIAARFGVRPALKKGSKGVFEVMVGDELIFSKKALGRFPDDDEIYALLDRHRPGA